MKKEESKKLNQTKKAITKNKTGAQQTKKEKLEKKKEIVIENSKENNDDKRIKEDRTKSLKRLKIAMIVIDVLFIPLLILDIVQKDVNYFSIIVIIFCNFITFITKEDIN